MSCDRLRLTMATHILNFEALRDRAGRLCLVRRGDVEEVPGLTSRTQARAAAKVRKFLLAGQFDKAEAAAVDAVANYTDKMAGLSRDPGVEFYLRDCCWELGPKGANAVVQHALGFAASGVMDDPTRAALRGAERAPHAFLRALKVARAIEAEMDRDKRWSAALRIAVTLSPKRYMGEGFDDGTVIASSAA